MSQRDNKLSLGDFRDLFNLAANVGELRLSSYDGYITNISCLIFKDSTALTLYLQNKSTLDHNNKELTSG